MFDSRSEGLAGALSRAVSLCYDGAWTNDEQQAAFTRGRTAGTHSSFSISTRCAGRRNTFKVF